MALLEGPDDPITLARAAQIAGSTRANLRRAAIDGRLVAQRPARDWFTTRRHLHNYLAQRSRGTLKPLPPDYQTPEGEEPIP